MSHALASVMSRFIRCCANVIDHDAPRPSWSWSSASPSAVSRMRTRWCDPPECVGQRAAGLVSVVPPTSDEVGDDASSSASARRGRCSPNQRGDLAAPIRSGAAANRSGAGQRARIEQRGRGSDDPPLAHMLTHSTDRRNHDAVAAMPSADGDEPSAERDDRCCSTVWCIWSIDWRRSSWSSTSTVDDAVMTPWKISSWCVV